MAFPASAWTPVHRHLTVDGVVPEHTHAYDRPHDGDRGAPGCVVVAATPNGEAHNETLVCAPDDGSATTSVAGTLQHEAVGVRLAGPGIDSLTSLSPQRDWTSVALGTLTPPPRSGV
jgi:hypothetical protein